MMFKKPKNLKYTDMAIYIDNHIYTDDCDEQKVYEYLYHLTSMLAFKAKYFDTYKKYEEFGMFAARYYFMRLKNPKQYIWDDKKNATKLWKINSILNYIKKSIYGVKVTFEQENYAQYSTENYVDNYTISNYCNLSRQLVETCDKFNRIDFFAYIDDIDDEIKDVIKDIPYKNQKALWNNIYLSCLLTLNNMSTLSNKKKKELNALKQCDDVYYNALNREYDQNMKEQVILYHLNKDMSDYISLLCNKIKKKIANELSSILNTYLSVDFVLSSIMNNQECVENEN